MANLPARQGTHGVASRPRQQHPLERFREEMESLFDQFWGGGWLAPQEGQGRGRSWGFDVDENEKEVTVRAEMPGFEENEVDVRLDNDVLTIKAEKEETEDGRREYESFFRQLLLPAGIDAEKAQASFRNGVLELHLPRHETSQPKRIPIRGQQAGTEAPAAKGGTASGREAAQAKANGGAQAQQATPSGSNGGASGQKARKQEERTPEKTAKGS